jgi:uncharacterized repeat protein (TIGR03803 family)
LFSAAGIFFCAQAHAELPLSIVKQLTKADGSGPLAKLVPHEGAFYGTTVLGGAFHKGTVFQLRPPADGAGAWSFRVLHNFQSTLTSGANPVFALAVDPETDTFYGSMAGGGINSPDCYGGCGGIFSLSLPNPDGAAQFKTLYLFKNKADGRPESGPLLFTKFSGTQTLAGVTPEGGNHYPDNLP